VPVPGKKEQHKSSVISVGTISKLLLLREAILQSSGFVVFSTTRLAEALAAMERNNFDVLLLCYSVRYEWRADLIHKFREYYHAGRVVEITDRPITQLPTDVDQVVYGIEGPDALMDAIRGRAA
jgi:DNA-binding response OmpR family regulator